MAITINGSGSVTGITTRLADAGAPAGSVIQVVQSTYTAANSGTINDGAAWDLESILSATLTPSQSDSQILVTIQLCTGCSAAGAIPAHLHRKIGSGSASAVVTPTSYSSRLPTTISMAHNSTHALVSGTITYLDSPNTTDACKYWANLYHQAGASATVYLNRSHVDSDDTSYSRGISNIVLQEIAV